MNNDIDNPNSEYWKQKYLKYKSKYMNLNNTTGGRRHSRRSNSPLRNFYNSPFRPQYPMLPQMPLIVTNSDSNLTIGNDNSDVSIVMPLSPLGPFVRGNTMIGPNGQFMAVLSPRSAAKKTTTPSTSFKDDPIYKAHGTTIENNSTIYFRIQKGTDYLVNNSDKTVIERSLNNSSPYSEQIEKHLKEILDSPPILSDIKKNENFMVVNSHFVFKFTTSTSEKPNFSFENNSIIKDKEKIGL